MKLHDKIYYCRKKAGLSQEALAEKLGVSRQSVSKWETGESVPELNKIPIIAKIFNVTTDWLLSEDAPVENENAKSDTQKAQRAQKIKEEFSSPAYPQWLDNIPHFISNILKRFGWLGGLYVSVCGLMFTVIGGIAKYFSKVMFADVAFSQFVGPFSDSVFSTNPVSLISNFILIIGIALIIIGIILAVIIKRYSKKQ